MIIQLTISILLLIWTWAGFLSSEDIFHSVSKGKPWRSATAKEKALYWFLAGPAIWLVGGVWFTGVGLKKLGGYLSK